jgi:hypothetical protein
MNVFWCYDAWVLENFVISTVSINTSANERKTDREIVGGIAFSSMFDKISDKIVL